MSTEIAEVLYRAQERGSAIPQFGTELNLDKAYAVQNQILVKKQSNGEKLTGRKLGFTSKAKMAQMGVNELIVGFLTDSMEPDSDGQVSLAHTVHPRVEPEIAFLFGKDVSPDDDLEVWEDAITKICAAIEIIDSRYQNFVFSLPDVVADNTSACRYIVGDWQSFQLPLQNARVELELDGKIQATGDTAAILGGPWNVVAELHKLAQKYQFSLSSGDILLAGAATEAIPVLDANQIRVSIEGLGSVEVRIRKG